MNEPLGHPIWWLRGSLSGVLFALLFGWMAMDNPSFKFGYAIAAANIVIAALLAAIYWYWPRSQYGESNEPRGGN